MDLEHEIRIIVHDYGSFAWSQGDTPDIKAMNLMKDKAVGQIMALIEKQRTEDKAKHYKALRELAHAYELEMKGSV